MTDPTPRSTPEVILGSASPARLSVLRAAGLAPRVMVSDVDEGALIASLGPNAEPADVVLRLAEAKSQAIIAALRAKSTAPTEAVPDAVVLTCDSMLLFDGELTGKPHTREVAAAQWARMRGRSAQLLTGHCVTRLTADASLLGDVSPATSARETSSTTIRFADISDEEIAAYVATDEPLSVAGAFTLDALGGWFIDGIDGNPSAVLGIGLPTVRRLLAELDVRIADLWKA